MRPLVPVAVACVVAALLVPVTPAAAQPAGVDYDAPVAAPLVDVFRPPTHRYGSGNRGLTYATEPGTPIGATAPGVVVFAGPVAGHLVVSVRHADGLRSTYTGLQTLQVAAGRSVAAGDVLGLAGDEFHFGVKAGDAYLDPSVLIGGEATAHLVAADGAPTSSGPSPYGGVLDALDRIGSLGRSAIDGAGDLAAGAYDVVAGGIAEAIAYGRLLLEGVWDTARYLGHLANEWSPGSMAYRIGEALVGALDDCTGASVAVPAPPERRIAVWVPGLGGDDEGSIPVDTAELGYASGDVVRFSYTGGAVPGSGTALGIGGSGFDPPDTTVDLRDSGRALRELLAEVTAAAPGVPIDVIAHSQGGLVARVAMEDAGSGATTLTTIGTPHRGADLATALAGVTTTNLGGAAELVADEAGWSELLLGHDLDAPSIEQMAEHSAFLAGLGPLAADVSGRSIASRTDAMVPVPRTRADGLSHVVVDAGGHSGMQAHDATTREIGLHLAGMAGTCRPFAARIADVWAGETLALATDGLGLAAWYGAFRLERAVPGTRVTHSSTPALAGIPNGASG